MRKSVVFLAVVCLLMALAVPVYAQGGEIPTFDRALTMAAGSAVAVIVGLLLSWAVEWFPQYEKLAPRVKRVTFLGLCLIVPVLAVTLRGLLGYAQWSFDPLYWHALWNGFAAYVVGNLAHIRKLPTA